MIWEFPGRVDMNLFKIENLVLWVRSEMIGFAVDQICSWVSGVSKYRILNTDLVAAEDQHR